MTTSTFECYDGLADKYHLITHDWDQAVRYNGKVLDACIRKHFPHSPNLSVLDCSCGIGTQAIGLALLGYRVHATDLSPKSVERARQQAARLNADLSFGVADFRTLDHDVQGNFDVVISCDNSLPHLLTDQDLKTASLNINRKLKPGGLLIATIRDYDELLKTRPAGVIPKRICDRFGERIYTQVWTWEPNKNTYKLEFFLIIKSEAGWITHSFNAEYRALTRAEFTNILSQSGYSQIEWGTPNSTGYYQPMVIARRGA